MKIIGLMSGTSLDGLDIALCDFSSSPSGAISYTLLAAETYPYPEQWVSRLSSLEHASAFQYALADVELGHYLGRQVLRFLQTHPAEVDLVASHGHTIFHQPSLGLTTQIGDGNAIAAETGLPVAFNFRQLDVALGGQGAPLVPIGDQLLFSHFDACLNLGGFSNISFSQGASRLAFDISPCNMALNVLARRLDLPFDRDGLLARGGNLLPELLSQMNQLGHYSRPAPKSLGKEWFVSQFLPLLSSGQTVDLLRTVVEHIAFQIAQVLNSNHISSLLVTGGGANNAFLLERISVLAPHCQIQRPQPEVVDYKEAIIFALLGYLRLLGRPNCLSSVTGARFDSCSGLLVHPAPIR